MNPEHKWLAIRQTLMKPGLYLLLGGMLILSACASATTSVATFTAEPGPAQPAATVTLVEEAMPGVTTIPELPSAIPSPPVIQATGEPETMNIEPGLEPLIEQAVADLAQRLHVAEGAIQLLRAESVTWPDASLGCPQPGMQYIQVPEDGALILLEANGIEYEYHSGGKRGLFLCEKVVKDLDPSPKIDLTKHIPPPRDSGSP